MKLKTLAALFAAASLWHGLAQSPVKVRLPQNCSLPMLSLHPERFSPTVGRRTLLF